MEGAVTLSVTCEVEVGRQMRTAGMSTAMRGRKRLLPCHRSNTFHHHWIRHYQRLVLVRWHPFAYETDHHFTYDIVMKPLSLDRSTCSFSVKLWLPVVPIGLMRNKYLPGSISTGTNQSKLQSRQCVSAR